MSLDVYLSDVYTANITHNLNKMAMEADIYMALWRPEEIGIVKAEQLIGPLTEGLSKLAREPKRYRQFNSPNGWGMYEHLVSFVEDYLEACKANPSAEVRACR
jgi:hypothetical protein